MKSSEFEVSQPKCLGRPRSKFPSVRALYLRKWRKSKKSEE